MIVVVEPGDTLSEIALRLTGDAANAARLICISRTLTDRHQIFPGDKFLVPSRLLLPATEVTR